jgi:hypothetical protein
MIVLATPCFGGMVNYRYVTSVLALCANPSPKFLVMFLANSSLVTRARNIMVAKFLETPDATHILFVDADTIFKPEDAYRLLAANEDVVAGRYPLKTYPIEPVGEAVPGAEVREDGFVEAMYGGTGFMLIHRSVFVRMLDQYPEITYHTKEPGVDHHAFFECGIEPETKVYFGEDVMFCHRWRQMGGQVWLDTKSRLSHVGTHNFSFDGEGEAGPP